MTRDDEISGGQHWRDAPVSIDADEQLAGAIRRLAAEGARVRDIASLLSVHSLIVQRALGNA